MPVATLEPATPIHGPPTLEIAVRIQDGPRYAALGHDVRAFDAVLSCVGIAEAIHAYSEWVTTGKGTEAYSASSLKGLDAMIRLAVTAEQSWIDTYESGRHWAGVYGLLISARRGGPRNVGVDEYLRVELVQLRRENPTVAKILATGAARSMLLLSALIGGVVLVGQFGAEGCRQDYMHYSERQMEKIRGLARLEGHLSENHVKGLKVIQHSMDAGISACGFHLRNMEVRYGRGGIRLNINESPDSK